MVHFVSAPDWEILYSGFQAWLLTHISIFPRDVVDHEFVTPVEVDPVLTGVAQLLFQ